jgi:hypothetical protein
MKRLQIRFALIIAVVLSTAIRVTGQTGMPDVLLKNSLKEQLNYLDEHTKIYENYRAVREDMFQKLKQNVNDTLIAVTNRTNLLISTRSSLSRTIDTLKAELVTTTGKLDQMTRTKDSIKVLGIEINKSAYNRVMWTILAILVVALLGGFMVFKRNLTAISNSKKEFQDLKTEFDTYRKTSREAREKMTMDHFNEIKRLKGG